MFKCLFTATALFFLTPSFTMAKEPFIIHNNNASFTLRVDQDHTVILQTGVEKTGEPVDWCWVEEESAGLLALAKKEVVWPPKEFFIWLPSIHYTFKACKPGQGKLVFTRPNGDSDANKVYWIIDFTVHE